MVKQHLILHNRVIPSTATASPRFTAAAPIELQQCIYDQAKVWLHQRLRHHVRTQIRRLNRSKLHLFQQHCHVPSHRLIGGGPSNDRPEDFELILHDNLAVQQGAERLVLQVREAASSCQRPKGSTHSVPRLQCQRLQAEFLCQLPHLHTRVLRKRLCDRSLHSGD
eukprot:197156-Prymnesium_polylepis.2